MTVEQTLDKLQERLWGKNAEKEYNFHHSFIYTKQGHIEAISLQINEENFSIEMNLWNSENEDREWVEEKKDYEDLFYHILCKYKKAINRLLKLKKDLKCK